MGILQCYINDTLEYLTKVFDKVRVGAGIVCSFICCILFPNKQVTAALLSVLAAASFDIITKFYCISKKNGGYKKAVKTKKIWSKTLWELTEIKIISYLVISLLVGLSYRVSIIDIVPQALGSFVYSMMFLRESQSIIENLIESGADLEWLLIFTKKKQEDINDKFKGGKI